MRIAYFVFALMVSVFAVRADVRAAELVYFHSAACSVCERWDNEIGAIYDRTDEAVRLPLRSHDIRKDKPADLQFIKGVAFTPTFVVVEDGREIGRIVGYIADYFFWEQISGLIKKADGAKAQPVAACPNPDQNPIQGTC